MVWIPQGLLYHAFPMVWKPLGTPFLDTSTPVIDAPTLIEVAINSIEVNTL